MSNIPTIQTSIFVCFVSPEFRWIWLVAGNFKVRKVGVLDEDGGLTFGGWSGGDCIKRLKYGGV